MKQQEMKQQGMKKQEMEQQEMRKQGRLQVLTIVLCLILVCGITAGCGSLDSEGGNTDKNVSDGGQESSVYSVKIGDRLYSVGQCLDADTAGLLADECEAAFFEGEYPFSDMIVYSGENFTIKTWRNKPDGEESTGAEDSTGEAQQEANGSETVYYVKTYAGETEKGLKTGASLAEAKAVYPELAFYFGSCVDDNGEFLDHTRKYRYYDETDDTNRYLDLWFSNADSQASGEDGGENGWVLFLIEAGEALDEPRELPPERGSLLGIDELHMEMPDGFTTRIFRENADGSEEEIKCFQGAAEQADLDGDGLPELICSGNQNGYRNIFIMDNTKDGMIELDVNSVLGCKASDHAALIGNIKPEYQNCVVAMPEPGSAASELYDYQDGRLTYRCLLEEALR